MTTISEFKVTYRDDTPSDTFTSERYDIADGWVLFFEGDRSTQAVKADMVRKIEKAQAKPPVITIVADPTATAEDLIERNRLMTTLLGMKGVVFA